jgi:hypothetical protein
MDTTMKTMRSVLLAQIAAIAVAAASGCSAGDAVPAGDESQSVGTAASADYGYPDQYVQVNDNGGFDMRFWPICVNPDGTWIYGGNSPRMGTGDSVTLNLSVVAGLQDGANCWVSMDAFGGWSNHQAGTNFTYSSNNGRTAVYNCDGGVDSVEWHLISN